VIGVPVPGTELKLVPSHGKLEVRVKGPNVFTGYWKQPELTAKSFDDEGYYLIGDAVEFVDAAHPERGLLYDGRVGEDFKLLTGTWVHVGSVRVAGIDAMSPIAQDIVVTGHDRDEIGFLIFPNLPECRRLCPHLATRRRHHRPAAQSGDPQPRRAGHGGDDQEGRGLLHLSDARHPDGRAALGRGGGDHRQGLHQPARGAHASRRPGRVPLRRRARQDRHHGPSGGVSFHRKGNTQ
jgi:hypothetical protein